jgi:site-specific recombinase XerD
MQKQYVEELTKTNAVKKSTLKQVNSLFNNLKKFAEAKQYPMTFGNMGFDFYQKYGDWVLVDEDNYDGFYGSLVKRLRTWLGWCVDEKGINVNPQFRSKKFKVLTEEFDVVYLTTKELEWLDEFRNHENCKPSWIRIIDMTLVQASVGCRYSDMVNASWYFEDDMLRGYTTKNASSYKIPVKSSKWIQILKDYNMTFQLPVRHSTKIQVLSDVKFNKYLKECLRAMYAAHGLHIEEHEQLVKKHTKRGVPTFERKYKWEMITSHSLRRSFVSRMVRLNYKQEEVAFMIGTKNISELRKYFKLEIEDLRRRATEIHG